MTADEYREALEALGLTQGGGSARPCLAWMIERHAAGPRGERDIPPPAQQFPSLPDSDGTLSWRVRDQTARVIINSFWLHDLSASRGFNPGSARPWQAASRSRVQPWKTIVRKSFGVGLAGLPEREQRLAVGLPVGLHLVGDVVRHVGAAAIAVTMYSLARGTGSDPRAVRAGGKGRGCVRGRADVAGSCSSPVASPVIAGRSSQFGTRRDDVQAQSMQRPHDERLRAKPMPQQWMLTDHRLSS